MYQQKQVIAAATVTTTTTVVVVNASSINEKPSMTAIISEEMTVDSYSKAVKFHYSNEAAASRVKKMNQHFAQRERTQEAD